MFTNNSEILDHGIWIKQLFSIQIPSSVISNGKFQVIIATKRYVLTCPTEKKGGDFAVFPLNVRRAKLSTSEQPQSLISNRNSSSSIGSNGLNKTTYTLITASDELLMTTITDDDDDDKPPPLPPRARSKSATPSAPPASPTIQRKRKSKTIQTPIDIDISLMKPFDVAVMLIRKGQDKPTVTATMLAAKFSRGKILVNYNKAKNKLNSSTPPPPSPKEYIETIVDDGWEDVAVPPTTETMKTDTSSAGIEQKQPETNAFVEEVFNNAHAMGCITSNGQTYTKHDIQDVVSMNLDLDMNGLISKLFGGLHMDTIRSKRRASTKSETGGGGMTGGGGGGHGFSGGGVDTNNNPNNSNTKTINEIHSFLTGAGSIDTSTNQPYTLNDVSFFVDSHTGSSDTLFETIVSKMHGGLHMQTVRARADGSLKISLKQTSVNQLECAMCTEKISRGTRGVGDQSVAATNLCDHWFCFGCIGDYLKDKITKAEVTDAQLSCPLPSCDKSMLLDPENNYNPQYLFNSYRGSAGGILGQAFDFEEAEALNAKFLEHRFRLSKVSIPCPNPKCQIPLDIPKDQQFFRCNKSNGGCGEAFCSKCWKKAHNDIKDCAMAAANGKADEALDEMKIQYVAEGGRFCPECGDLSAAEDPDPYKWKCDHMTCACGYQFCRNCGANHLLTRSEDNSFHVPACGLYGTYDGAKPDTRRPTDWPAVWKEKDPQFNGQGRDFFGNIYPQHKAKWISLGILKSKGENGGQKIKGFLRKCQPNCNCGYGSGHSEWTSSADRVNRK